MVRPMLQFPATHFISGTRRWGENNKFNPDTKIRIFNSVSKVNTLVSDWFCWSKENQFVIKLDSDVSQKY